MTATDREHALVIGVGPQGLSAATIGFAVETADRLDLDLDVVHVVPTLVGWPTGTIEMGIALEQLTRAGRSTLDAAVARVREVVAGRHAVSGELVHGGVVDGLVGRSTDAALVVLERHQHTRWQRLLSGETTAQTAARAHAPVVVVPATWTPSTLPLPLTVGCEDAQRAEAELWTALGLAAATDRTVRVVRATYLAQAYQEILRREVREDDFLAATRAELVQDAARPAELCAGVPCEFEARWGRPADVLVDLSERSSLLVLARRDPGLPLGSHLGPVVRQVLSESRCPVMVVEPTLHEPVRVGARAAADVPA